MGALLLHVVERRQVGLDLHDLEVAVGKRLIDLGQLEARALRGEGVWGQVQARLIVEAGTAGD